MTNLCQLLKNSSCKILVDRACKQTLNPELLSSTYFLLELINIQINKYLIHECKVYHYSVIRTFTVNQL